MAEMISLIGDIIAAYASGLLAKMRSVGHKD